MGRGRPKRVIPITNPIKKIARQTIIAGKEKARDTEDMHSPQVSMEQLKILGEMWPPLHGSSSTQSPPTGNGGHNQTKATSTRTPIAEMIDADKVNQMKVTEQLGTNKPITEQEAQIHKQLDAE
ncbi:hypothetical protein A4A49_57785, partial [Nicotiana attenuata]